MKNRPVVAAPIVATLLLVVATLACRLSPAEPRKLDIYPSPTIEAIVATQTARIEQITTTPPATTTPIVIVATATSGSGRFCVDADIAVYLRPSPGDGNYPIMPLPNGAIVADLGGRSGNWYFVSYQDKQGWVHSDYLTLLASELRLCPTS